MAKSDIQLDAEFKWNKSSVQITADKGFGKALNKYFADVFADYSDEFVPYYEGDLSHYVQTFGGKDHGTVTYQVPYSAAQYHGEWKDSRTGKLVHVNEANRCKFVHELATSYWDKAAWAMYRDDIVREVDKKRKELSK